MFKSAMILIADLSRFDPQSFAPKVVIIHDLLRLFADRNFNKECKNQIVITIGDIFLACTAQAEKIPT